MGAPAFRLPPQPKTPGLAFLISLLLPGLGQFYCGKVKRGLWTLVFFLLAMAGVVFLLPHLEKEAFATLWGIALRAALVLYGFGFLDAYFTAREISAGTHQHMLENPRVAAVLNLLTRGFGYWYVGERKKAIIFFFLLGAATRAVENLKNPAVEVWVSVLVELALVALAVDAYRLAKKDFEGRLEVAAAPPPLQFEPGLAPAIPLALGAILTLGYAAFVAMVVLMPDYSVIDQSKAKFTQHADGKSYANPLYGIELDLPAGWDFDRSDPDYIVVGNTLEGGCQVGLLAEATFPFVRLEAVGESLVEQILATRKDFRLVKREASTLAGVPAHEMVFSADVEGTEVLQHYVMARRGLSRYTLVITVAGVLAEDCEGDIGAIRQSLVLSK